MDTPVTLAEELLLLALDPATGKPRCRGSFLQYGLAGAVLAELEAAGRIVEDHGRITLMNPVPIGDPVLDGALASLPGPRKAKGVRIQRWIRGSSWQIEEACARRLAQRGAIRIEKHRSLLFFRYHLYPSAGYDWSTPAVARFRSAAKVRFPDRRSRMLAGLVSAVDLASGIVPGSGGARRIRREMHRLTDEQWPASAVRRTVRLDKVGQSAGGGG
ncbi:GPP34 family phosphoprotein [Streptomyces sp. NPDC048639]|uniref:GOLPH3/VPS74 family protein n=1 Tax=Streptomyces sp. NPDC048639 TaxID=3365581 RepID=UPI0037172479